MTRLCPAVLLALLVASGEAQAAVYTITVCGKYDIGSLMDARPDFGDDVLNDLSVDPVARGARIAIKRNADNVVVREEYADVVSGCISPTTLSSNNTYTITLWAEAEIGGNLVEVRNSSAALYGYSATLTPTSSGTVAITGVDVTGSSYWNIAAAAGTALYRDHAGISGETWSFRTAACPSSSNSSCYNGGLLYINPGIYAGGLSKYVIAHEMGHQIQSLMNGGAGASYSYNADPGSCASTSASGHSLDEKEYHGAAANEGFAHFYAAVSFNNAAQSDCRYPFWRALDWDLDGSADYAINAAPGVNCEGSPFTGIAANNYLENDCASGFLNNRAFEYDYLRFLWDLRTDYDISTQQLFEVWDLSDPEGWNISGNGTGGAYPAARLWSAAQAHPDSAVGDAWDAIDHIHGVDH